MHKHRRMVLLVLLILLSGMLPVAQPVTPVAAAPVDEVEVDDMQQTTLSSTSVAVSPIDEVESNDTAEEAQSLTAIGLERPVRAAIDVAGDNDWYAFDVVAERTYVVELYHVDSSLSARSRRYACFRPMYDTYAGLGMVVYDANGNRVTENCAPDGSGNVHAIMEFTSRSEGRFTLRVFPHESTVTGNYYLRILPKHGEPGAAWNAETFEPNNGLSNAYLLQPGLSNAVTSTIEARRPIYSTVYGDNDWYRIETTSENVYVVEIYNVDSGLSVDSSRYQCFNNEYREYAGLALVIYDTDGNLVKPVCYPDGKGNVHTSIEFTSTSSAVYYIRIFPHSGTVDGQYSLRVLPRHNQKGADWNAETFEPNNYAANAYEIDIGRDNSLISTIEQRQAKFSTNFPDVDWYRFAGVAEQDYVVEIFNVESSMNKDGNACTRSGSRPAGLALFVYDPNFTVDFPKGGCRPTGNGRIHTTVQFKANDTGWFYIRIFPNGYNAQGTYTIRVRTADDIPPDNGDAPSTGTCACPVVWLTEVWCESTTRALAGTLAGTLLQDAATLDLDVFYGVRDVILQPNSTGERYIDLYNTHAPEITQLLTQDSELQEQAVAALNAWQPNLAALVEGNGETMTITDEQMQTMNTFLDSLAVAGSTELQDVIAAEREAVAGLAGQTMDEATQEVLAEDYTIYLPLTIR